RVPWTLGCNGQWKDKEAQYQDAVAMDRRIVCAGEHLSYLPAWMEGALLSGLDAIARLHDVAVCNAGEWSLSVSLSHWRPLAWWPQTFRHRMRHLWLTTRQSCSRAVRFSPRRPVRASMKLCASPAIWQRAQAPKAQASTRHWPTTRCSRIPSTRSTSRCTDR